MEKTRDDSQIKKHQESTPRQPSGTTNTPSHRESDITPILPTIELPVGTTRVTTVAPSAEDLQRTLFTTPHQTAPIVNNTVPPGAPNRERVPDTETNILTLEEDAPELTLSNFVSQNYETLISLMQEEARKRSIHSLHARLNFGAEKSPPRHQERENNEKRTNIHARLGTASNSQYSEEYEDNERHTNVHARLGSRRIQDRLGRQRSPRAPQGQEAEESRIDLGDSTPQVEALQTRTPRKNGASATKGKTPPQVTPRTTRIEKQDIGNLETDVVMRRIIDLSSLASPKG